MSCDCCSSSAIASASRRQRLARVVLATAGETRAERVERLPLLGARADRAGDGERLLAARDRLMYAPAEHQQLALGRDDARAFGAGRIGRERRDCFAERFRCLVVAAHDPEVASQSLLHQPGADRITRSVEPGRRVTRQRDRSLAIGDEVRRVGGAARQVDPIHPGAGLGVLDAVPDVERVVEVPLGLRERGDPCRGAAGLDRRREGCAELVGGLPVVGELRGRDRGALARQVRSAGQRTGDRGVEAGALARQDVRVQDLAQQRVAERVCIAAAAHQDVVG